MTYKNTDHIILLYSVMNIKSSQEGGIPVEEKRSNLDLIRIVLADRGVKRSWLAYKVSCSKGHITNVLNNNKSGSDELVDAMLTALKLNEKATSHDYTKRVPRNTSQDWQC